MPWHHPPKDRGHERPEDSDGMQESRRLPGDPANAEPSRKSVADSKAGRTRRFTLEELEKL
jgi:hypothetical protein